MPSRQESQLWSRMRMKDSKELCTERNSSQKLFQLMKEYKAIEVMNPQMQTCQKGTYENRIQTSLRKDPSNLRNRLSKWFQLMKEYTLIEVEAEGI
jgi:hypothetical protein